MNVEKTPRQQEYIKTTLNLSIFVWNRWCCPTQNNIPKNQNMNPFYCNQDYYMYYTNSNQKCVRINNKKQHIDASVKERPQTLLVPSEGIFKRVLCNKHI